MTYTAFAPDGTAYPLPAPQSVELNLSEEAPADDFLGVFPLEKSLPELDRLELWSGRELVFEGWIDEQTEEIGPAGLSLCLAARSRVALLLDNEARPQNYRMPSLKLLFERHLQPYGFTGYLGDDAPFSAALRVEKGMSEWEVLELFCRDYLHVVPRFTAEGVCDARGFVPGDELLFSNAGGLPCAFLTRSIRRCDPISEILLRPKDSADYSVRVADDGLLAAGIRRRRYLNADGEDETPAVTAQRRITTSRRDYLTYRLLSPGPLCALPGQAARVDFPVLGRIGGLVVSDIEYRLGPDGEGSRLLLRPAGTP